MKITVIGRGNVGGGLARARRPQRGVRVERPGQVDRRRPDGEVVQPQPRELTETLIRDAGYEPVSAGGLENARAMEDSLALLFAINQAGLGPFFMRLAPPGDL